MKPYHCKVCGIELVPREDVPPARAKSSERPSLEDRRLCLHHIDYQKNIAIRVCPACHVNLHNALKNHPYGINNVIREDGRKKGPISPGRYPKKIIE